MTAPKLSTPHKFPTNYNKSVTGNEELRLNPDSIHNALVLEVKSRGSVALDIVRNRNAIQNLRVLLSIEWRAERHHNSLWKSAY